MKGVNGNQLSGVAYLNEVSAKIKYIFTKLYLYICTLNYDILTPYLI